MKLIKMDEETKKDNENMFPHWLEVTFLSVFILFLLYYMRYSWWSVIMISISVYLIYLSFFKMPKTDLKVEFMPPKKEKYEKTIEKMNTETEPITKNNFEKIDEFALNFKESFIVYHFQNPCQTIHVNLNEDSNFSALDLITIFADNYFLTTSNSMIAGNNPLSDKALLQVYENAGFEHLLKKHQQAIEYLENFSLKPVAKDPADYRLVTIKSLKENHKKLVSQPFWLFKTIFRSLTRYGKKYCKSIEKQHKEGAIILQAKK